MDHQNVLQKRFIVEYASNLEYWKNCGFLKKQKTNKQAKRKPVSKQGPGFHRPNLLDKDKAEYKTVLSPYTDSLENRTKKRYTEKISVIGIDPLVIPPQKYIPECLPPVEACDHLSYLVLETSFYTKDQFKNFWSLPAYSHVVSGLIKDVFGQIVQEKYVVLAKVRHSHRKNDPRVQLWIITTKQQGWIQGSLPDFRNSLKFFPTYRIYSPISRAIFPTN